MAHADRVNSACVSKISGHEYSETWHKLRHGNCQATGSTEWINKDFGAVMAQFMINKSMCALIKKIKSALVKPCLEKGGKTM